MPAYQDGEIQVWLAGSMSLSTTITTNYNFTKGIFVSKSGNMYLDNGKANQSIGIWNANTNSYISALSIEKECYGIFVHNNGSLYCSMEPSHKVVMRSINSSDTQVTIVAGTGCAGPYSNLLYHPGGIFVTVDFRLYVADSGNNRIQLFLPGQLNATTVAGIEAPGTTKLWYPTGVILDGNGYLFIVDMANNRVVRSGPGGFQCVGACTGAGGPGLNQLGSPTSMAFDSFGNVFVADQGNSRIQKFLLVNNTCSE